MFDRATLKNATLRAAFMRKKKETFVETALNRPISPPPPPKTDFRQTKIVLFPSIHFPSPLIDFSDEIKC